MSQVVIGSYYHLNSDDDKNELMPIVNRTARAPIQMIAPIGVLQSPRMAGVFEDRSKMVLVLSRNCCHTNLR